MAYTKLFNSIVTSTIWTEDDATRIVWITMLAISDKNGEVQASVPGLARVAGVSVESCRGAIEKFLSPDPDSRTKDDEGRRIEQIEGGWHLLNYQKYREMASREDTRLKEATRKARYRARKARNVPKCPTDVPPMSTVDLHIAEADAEADAKKEKNRGRASRFVPPSLEEVRLWGAKSGLPDQECEKFWNYYEANGWKVGKNKMNSWPHAATGWKMRWEGSANGSHKQNYSKPAKTRNTGTANDGLADQYRMV